MKSMHICTPNVPYLYGGSSPETMTLTPDTQKHHTLAPAELGYCVSQLTEANFENPNYFT